MVARSQACGALLQEQKPRSAEAAGSPEDKEFRSNSGSVRIKRPFTRSWRFRTPVKSRATFGGMLRGETARFPFVKCGRFPVPLDQRRGIRESLPAYAPTLLSRLLISVHPVRRAAAAGLHANHPQS